MVFLKYKVIKTPYSIDENNKLKFLFIPNLSNTTIRREIPIIEMIKTKIFLSINILFPLIQIKEKIHL